MAMQESAVHVTAPSGSESWGLEHAHDPTIVRDLDGTWFMFSTDALAGTPEVPAGVHVRTSSDLVHWRWHGVALDGVPALAREWSGASGLWAPEVVRWPAVGEQPARWHMYYSASTFGSTRSAIGLAVADELRGPWRDHGIVVRTDSVAGTPNAIDAAVVWDADTAPWLVYGSFFAGIHVLPLGAKSGHPGIPGDQGVVVARRPASVDRAIEGAYVLHRPERDDFVMFVSYDSLFTSYSIRTAVAAEVTGPYLDRRGNELVCDDDERADAAGTMLLGSHRFDGGVAWLAPGHNSVFNDGDYAFVVHHVRRADRPGDHEAQIRRLYFLEDGWPVVSPQPYAGPADCEAGALPSEWNVIRFDRPSGEIAESRRVSIAHDALFDGEPLWLRLAVEGRTVDAVVFASWDAVAGRPALSFSGFDEGGVSVMGTARS